jgi:hypothetical protein
VIGKTEEAEKNGDEWLKALNRMKSRGKPPSEAQLADNQYIIVISSLVEADACVLLQVYRFRRRIELVFKRLKPLFGYNQIPSQVEASAKAWFYGRLLPAAFCETWANKARFSPCLDRFRPQRTKRTYPR